MVLDDFDYRPITFQGVTFPASLMAIDVLEPMLSLPDDELSDWLWRLPICRGTTKSAPAELCARCARQSVDIMLEHRQPLLNGISERLAQHGFTPEETYRDWLLALQHIAELSLAATGNCSWSAPLHPRDTLKSAADFDRLLKALKFNS